MSAAGNGRSSWPKVKQTALRERIGKFADKNRDNHKKISSATLKAGAKAISKEVIINYLANYLGIFINWVEKNVLPLLIALTIPIILALYAAFIQFTNKTFKVTGWQIVIALIITFTFIILIFTSAKIRKIYITRHKNYHDVFGLIWRSKNTDIIGPYCPHCIKGVIEDDHQEETVDQTLSDMFGEDREYVYSCSRCEGQIKLKIPIEELKLKAHHIILEKITDQ